MSRKVAKYANHDTEIILIPTQDETGYRDGAAQFWSRHDEVARTKITEGVAIFDDEKSAKALYKAAREGLQAGLSAHAVQSIIRALLNPKPELPDEPTHLGAKIKLTSLGDTVWTASSRERGGQLVWRSDVSGDSKYWSWFEGKTVKVIFGGWAEED